MLNSCELVAFVAATDLDRARMFYSQVLGLPPVEQNSLACVFDANGTMLRVTAVPTAPSAGYTVLGWRVPDITAAARGLSARGVTFLRFDGMDQDEDGVWVSPDGARVAWFADPDGNTLSLTEFPRAVPGADTDA
jgi:catechol 2,3-dioxygenase-like lactoylglutathione lyase family enzyme